MIKSLPISHPTTADGVQTQLKQSNRIFCIYETRNKDSRGKKLQDFADIVLDTGAPPGDAMVKIAGLDTPVAPGSTVGGCLLVNSLKAEVAQRAERVLSGL